MFIELTYKRHGNKFVINTNNILAVDVSLLDGGTEITITLPHTHEIVKVLEKYNEVKELLKGH